MYPEAWLFVWVVQMCRVRGPGWECQNKKSFLWDLWCLPSSLSLRRTNGPGENGLKELANHSTPLIFPFGLSLNMGKHLEGSSVFTNQCTHASKYFPVNFSAQYITWGWESNFFFTPFEVFHATLPFVCVSGLHILYDGAQELNVVLYSTGCFFFSKWDYRWRLGHVTNIGHRHISFMVLDHSLQHQKRRALPDKLKEMHIF